MQQGLLMKILNSVSSVQHDLDGICYAGHCIGGAPPRKMIDDSMPPKKTWSALCKADAARYPALVVSEEIK